MVANEAEAVATADDTEAPVEVIELPVEVMELPVEVIELPVEVIELPVEVIELPVLEEAIIELPVEASTHMAELTAMCGQWVLSLILAAAFRWYTRQPNVLPVVSQLAPAAHVEQLPKQLAMLSY